MPQPAVAPLPQDEPKIEALDTKTEAANEKPAASPEKAAFDEAIKSGRPTSIFKHDAEKAKKRLNDLGLDASDAAPGFMDIVPEARTIAAGIETAKKSAEAKIDTAETEAVTKVKTAMGEKVEAKAEAPIAAVVETPKPVEAKVDAKNAELEDLEERLKDAASKTDEDYKALKAFSDEHELEIDQKTLGVKAMYMDKLSPEEKKYVGLLQIERAAGRAEMEHLQMSLDAMKESDPKKKEEMMASAKVLEARTEVIEKEAEKASAEYLAMPKIAALAAAAAGVAVVEAPKMATDSTGGSFMAGSFEEPAKAAPPTGKGPPAGAPPTRTGSGTPLYNEDIYGKPAGVATIEVKPLPGGEPEKVTGVRAWVASQWDAVKGFWGGGGGGRSGGAH